MLTDQNQILESLKDHILVLDTDGRITYNNHLPSYLQQPDLIGKDLSAICGINSSETCSVNFTNAIEKQTGSCFDVNFMTPENDLIHLEITMSPLVHEQRGNSVLVVARDITQQKTEELKLIDRQFQFKSSFEHGTVPMAYFSFDGNIQMVNSSFAELFGYTLNQMIGMQTQQLMRDRLSLAEELKSQYHSTCGQKLSLELQEWCLRNDGTPFLAKIQLDVLQDNLTASNNYAIVFVEDITESERNREKLELQNRLLESIISQSSEGILVMDKNEEVIVWNDRMKSLYGDYNKQKPEDWSKAFGLFEKDRKTRLSKKDFAIIKAMNKNRKVRKEIFVQNPSQEQGSFLKVHSVPLKDNAKNILGGISIITDVTAEKLYKQRLEKSERKFRELVETAIDGILILDSQCKVILVNTSAEAIFETDRSKLLGKTMRELMRKDLAIFKAALSGKSKNKTSYNRKYKLKKKDGSSFYLEVSLNPINSENGQMIVCELRDVTNQVLAEREVLNSVFSAEEKERARLARDLHDGLGQNLGAASMLINSLATIAKDLLPEDEFSRFFLCKELINQSLLETRLISHNIMPKSLQHFGINQALQDLTDNLNIIYKDMKVDYNSNLNGFRFSNEIELALYRATQEIANNTIKHARASNLQIELRKDQNNIELSTRDDGVGFEKSKDGNGLGLESIKSRIESLRGEIDIHTSIGEGTGFSIKLPLDKESELLPKSGSEDVHQYV